MHSEPVAVDRRPTCFDHGCNGREFPTFSALLRHQHEKSCTNEKSRCPDCGAEFPDNTLRYEHMQLGKSRLGRTSPFSPPSMDLTGLDSSTDQRTGSQVKEQKMVSALDEMWLAVETSQQQLSPRVDQEGRHALNPLDPEPAGLRSTMSLDLIGYGEAPIYCSRELADYYNRLASRASTNFSPVDWESYACSKTDYSSRSDDNKHQGRHRREKRSEGKPNRSRSRNRELATASVAVGAGAGAALTATQYPKRQVRKRRGKGAALRDPHLAPSWLSTWTSILSVREQMRRLVYERTYHLKVCEHRRMDP